MPASEIWCKQIVYVQTCGLHRRSMNAPTMLIYKYIYLWPTKINHGYTVGATIGRFISNYLNCFSYINQQLNQTANQGSLWQRELSSQLTERLVNILFTYDIRQQVRLQIRLSHQGQSLRFFLRKTTSLYQRAAKLRIFGVVISNQNLM